MVIFFTSGTTGMPKMVRHTHSYPIGHLVTAKFAHSVAEGDVHWTVSDTGWAKTYSFCFLFYLFIFCFVLFCLGTNVLRVGLGDSTAS